MFSIINYLEMHISFYSYKSSSFYEWIIRVLQSNRRISDFRCRRNILDLQLVALHFSLVPLLHWPPNIQQLLTISLLQQHPKWGNILSLNCHRRLKNVPAQHLSAHGNIKGSIVRYYATWLGIDNHDHALKSKVCFTVALCIKFLIWSKCFRTGY